MDTVLEPPTIIDHTETLEYAALDKKVSDMARHAELPDFLVYLVDNLAQHPDWAPDMTAVQNIFCRIAYESGDDYSYETAHMALPWPGEVANLVVKYNPYAYTKSRDVKNSDLQVALTTKPFFLPTGLWISCSVDNNFIPEFSKVPILTELVGRMDTAQAQSLLLWLLTNSREIFDSLISDFSSYFASDYLEVFTSRADSEALAGFVRDHISAIYPGLGNYGVREMYAEIRKWLGRPASADFQIADKLYDTAEIKSNVESRLFDLVDDTWHDHPPGEISRELLTVAEYNLPLVLNVLRKQYITELRGLVDTYASVKKYREPLGAKDSQGNWTEIGRTWLQSIANNPQKMKIVLRRAKHSLKIKRV